MRGKLKSTKGCNVAVDEDDDDHHNYLINDTIFEKKRAIEQKMYVLVVSPTFV